MKMEEIEKYGITAKRERRVKRIKMEEGERRLNLPRSCDKAHVCSYGQLVCMERKKPG